MSMSSLQRLTILANHVNQMSPAILALEKLPAPVLIILNKSCPLSNAYPGSAHPSLSPEAYPVNPCSQQKYPLLKYRFHD
jgi:hypothetical protein